jgi:hypothetical protein
VEPLEDLKRKPHVCHKPSCTQQWDERTEVGAPTEPERLK